MMRLSVFLIAGLVGIGSAKAAPSVMAEYSGSIRRFLVLAGAETAARDRTDSLAAQTQAAEPARADSARPRVKKSPKKAFFLSLVLPGLGEMYAGRRIRGAVFLAIEGAAWTTWSIYRGRGKDWEDKYIAFQAEHWSFERYDAYRHAVWDVMCETTNKCDPTVRSPFQRQQDSLTVLVGSHHYDDIAGQEMPSDDDRYEMIGKYYRFSYGWDDVTEPADIGDSTKLLRDRFPDPLPGQTWGTDKEDWKTVFGGELVRPDIDTNFVYQVRHLDRVYSANREEYMRMRAKSNDAYGTARKVTTAILFNHLISAIHAARMARAANRDGYVEPPRTTMRMVLARTERDLVPMFVIWRRF